MRILVIHNFYQQPGGEDLVYRSEVELMRSHGDDVATLEFNNDAIEKMGRVELARKTVWNADAKGRIALTCDKFRPDVVHFHNTFPLVSPAGYSAARTAGAAVVQTLHNYRLICPSATLFRDGRVCEDCVGRTVPWPGVVHKCYRNSAAASAVTAWMLASHNRRGTWLTQVDRYIALTDFARRKMIEGGLPGEKIMVKPNFVVDSGVGPGDGAFVLFVGRLDAVKGVETLLKAWALPRSGALGRLKLRIIGDGPLGEMVRRAAAEDTSIVYDGYLEPLKVYELLGQARLLIVPSEWYEGGLPRTVIEAYAKGTPVLASRLGSMELIEEGVTGGLYRPGDSADLVEQAQRLLADENEVAGLRRGARAAFEATYTADQNYRMLRAVYQSALDAAVREQNMPQSVRPGAKPAA
jgi:glycosyltransferase involved in cell wall biosynthesis